MNFIFIGSPGAGKGTCAQYFAHKHGFINISPGDIIRNEINLQTALGKFVQPLYESGHYLDTNSEAETVVNQVACELIRNKLASNAIDGKNFIIDGFPRSEESFLSLHRLFSEQKLLTDLCYVEFIANKETCCKRISYRRICPQCFGIHSTMLMDAKRCTLCSSPLIARKNDTPEFARERIEFYYQTIEPVLHNLIKKEYRIEKIKTECTLDVLQDRYEKLLPSQI